VIAFVFPGQGSQYSGMGQDVAAEFAEAGEVFAQADRALGFSLSQLCFEGSEDELQLTETTQPAVLTTSVALSLESLKGSKYCQILWRDTVLESILR